MTDTAGMHFRRERVRIETQRHEIEGTLQLPNEGFRSRTTDFLNGHERDFLALTDAQLTWLDASRKPERHEYLALSAIAPVAEPQDVRRMPSGIATGGSDHDREPAPRGGEGGIRTLGRG